MKVLLIVIALCFVGLSLAYDCKPTIEGKKYDFTPLAQSSDDYVISRTQMGKGWDVLLNMCGPISNRVCPNDCAICQVWDYNCPTMGCGSASLGFINQVSWYLRDGEPVAKFMGGAEGRNSEIRFKCVPGSGIGFPQFTNEDPIKQFNFQWSTQYACTSTPPSNCVARIGNLEFNLDPLRSSNDFFVDPDYSLNICGSLVNGCVSNVTNSIACQRYPFVEYSLGDANKIGYAYADGKLTLSYSGGDGGRRTVYTVLCSSQYFDPFFYEENPAMTYNFIWRTPLACNSTLINNIIGKRTK